jgi:D-amino peptidase
MKLFIHWDMEGASGIHRRGQTWYWEEGVSPAEKAEGLELITADAISAVAAALEAGVDQVIVCDTHTGGGNILLDKVIRDPKVTWLGRSRGEENGKERWMPGLNETVDGLMLPGHHAKAGTPNAFLPHTQNLEWEDFQINGMSVGEMGIETCFAGHWDIPVVLAQGDAAACREAEAQFPGVVTAEVKQAVNHDSCTGLDPEAGRSLTAEKVKEAVAVLRTNPPKPFKPSLPMMVTIRMASVEGVERAMQMPGVRRIGDQTVEGTVERQCDILKWITGTGIE